MKRRSRLAPGTPDLHVLVVDGHATHAHRSPPFPEAPVIAATTWSWLASRHEFAGLLAEPQHEDPVSHLEDVREVVADHEHAVAAVAQTLDQVEHHGRLAHAESRRRLVEHHELRLTEQRARDGHLLALSTGHRADLVAHVGDRHGEVLEQLAGLLLHADLVELVQHVGRAAAGLLAPEEEVLDHVEVVAQCEVLVDGRDPEVRPRRSGS